MEDVKILHEMKSGKVVRVDGMTVQFLKKEGGCVTDWLVSTMTFVSHKVRLLRTGGI